jgi:hypothetical protein
VNTRHQTQPTAPPRHQQAPAAAPLLAAVPMLPRHMPHQVILTLFRCRCCARARRTLLRRRRRARRRQQRRPPRRRAQREGLPRQRARPGPEHAERCARGGSGTGLCPSRSRSTSATSATRRRRRREPLRPRQTRALRRTERRRSMLLRRMLQRLVPAAPAKGPMRQMGWQESVRDDVAGGARLHFLCVGRQLACRQRNAVC